MIWRLRCIIASTPTLGWDDSCCCLCSSASSCDDSQCLLEPSTTFVYTLHILDPSTRHLPLTKRHSLLGKPCLAHELHRHTSLNKSNLPKMHMPNSTKQASLYKAICRRCSEPHKSCLPHAAVQLRAGVNKPAGRPQTCMKGVERSLAMPCNWIRPSELL